MRGGEQNRKGCTVCGGVKCTQAGPGQGKLFGKDLAKAGSSQGGWRGWRVKWRGQVCGPGPGPGQGLFGEKFNMWRARSVLHALHFSDCTLNYAVNNIHGGVNCTKITHLEHS